MFKNRYRVVVAILLFLAGILNYIDRAALSVMAPLVKKELLLNDAQMGLLFSAFFLGYCIFCFLGGIAADKFGPRQVFKYAATTWSIFCAATAFVASFSQLLFVRVLFGMGEGPMGTTTNKSISNWFPKKEVGRAVGFTNAGQPLGAAIAAPLVGLVGLQYGWRVSFIVIGLLGILWVFAWCIFFRDKPEDHPYVSEIERDEIVNNRPASIQLDENNQVENHSIWHYIFSAPVIGIAAAFFCFNYIQFFFLSWLPSYFIDYQHLNIKSMSIIGMLPWLGATLGFLGGGVICDFVFKRTQNFLFSRKLIILIGLSVAAFAVLATAFAQSLWIAVSCITVATIFAYMTPQACWSLLQDIVPANKIGGAGGFVHLLANLAGIISPALTGFIIQYGSGYHTAFILASAFAFIGIIALLTMVKKQKNYSEFTQMNSIN